MATINKVELRVIDSLPMKEGLWIRHIKKDSINYLIIEQIIKRDLPYNASIPEEFCELNAINNVEKISKSKKSSTLTAYENVIESELKYQSIIYKLIIKGRNPVKLSENDFKNLPKNYKLPDITLFSK